jgi:uncharacterized membrane protein YfcA
MLAQWSVLSVTVIAITIFLYGVSKTAMPVAGVLAGPLLAAVLTPTVASAFALPLLLVGDLYALALYRSNVDWRLILRLIPGVLAGLLATAFLFSVLSATALSRILGALILVSVILEIVRKARNLSSELPADAPLVRSIKATFFGVLAGMTSMAANAGGTAMSLYLINMRVSTSTFMGTSAWFFFFINISKVPILINLDLLTGETLAAGVWFIPVIVAGAVAGSFIFGYMSREWFYWIALVVSAMAGLWLLSVG